jgi:hypothetical protein
MDEHQPPSGDIAAAGSPATPDALREIVARHHRTRTRTLGIALAVALVAGPLAGWAIGHGGGGGGQQLSTASAPNGSNGGNAVAAPSGSAGAVAGVAANPFGAANAPKATHLFTRTSSDGIVIRAYRQDPPPQPPEPSTSSTTPSQKPLPGVCAGGVSNGAPPGADSGAVSSGSASSGSSGSVGSSAGGRQITVNAVPAPGTPPCPGIPPACKATPSVLAELSSDAAVGQGFDAIDVAQPSDALSHLSTGMFGVPESSPAVFVTVQTGPGVATVRLRLPSGQTDSMAPVDGLAVLAHGSSVPPPNGTVVEALDSSGKVLTSMDVSQPGPKAMFACAFSSGATIVPLPARSTTTTR